MVLNLILSLVILFLSYLTGITLLRRRHFIAAPGIEFVFATFLGGSFTFALGATLVYANLNPVALLPVLIGLAAIGILRIAHFSNGIKEFMIDRYMWLMSIPALVFVAINGGGLFSSSIKLRNGPDLVGWLVSARYLCNGGTLSSLTESIYQQTGSRDLSQIFSHPSSQAFSKDSSIASIASTTDQYSGEFLLGANRLGIPGVQASVCNVLGIESLFNSYVALAATAIFISTLMLYLIGREIGKPKASSVGFAILGILNAAVFSVVFEGGFGQVLSLPAFLLIGISLASKEGIRARLTISCILIVVFAVSSYMDVIGISLGFLVIYLILNFPEIFDDWRRTKSKKSSQSLTLFFLEKTGLEKKRTSIRLLSIVLFFFIVAYTLLPLLAERIGGTGIVGGWGFGWFPAPGDIVGLNNWIPPDGNKHLTARNELQILVGFFSILTIFTVYLKNGTVGKRIYKSIFVFYLLFLLLEFTKPSQYWNTYAVWKAGLYLAPLFFGFVTLSNPKKRQNFIRLKVITLGSITILSLTSVSLWGYDYHRNSIKIDTMVSSQVSETIKTRDIYFSGVKGVGAGSASLTLLSDVHYLNSGRVGGVPTKRSVPARELVYLLHRSFCHQDADIDLSCAKGVFGLEPQASLEVSFVEGDFTVLTSN
jgi:hypothetical protein